MASSTAQVSLDGVTAAGAGTTVDFSTAKRTVSVMLIPSATLSAGIVTIEASMDGANWAIVRVVELIGRENSIVNLTGHALRYWRASVARTVSGGTIKVTFMEADS
jgi:hypothetical protein